MSALAAFCYATPCFAECERETYSVRKGDTLSEIILRKEREEHLHLKIYGKTGLLRELVSLNRKVIKNPEKIFPGQSILIPERLTPTLASVAGCARELAGAEGETETPSVTQIEAPKTEESAVADETPKTADEWHSGAEIQEKMKEEPNPESKEEESHAVAAAAQTETHAVEVKEQPPLAEGTEEGPKSDFSVQPETAPMSSEELPAKPALVYPQNVRVNLGVGMLVLDNLASIPALPHLYLSSKIPLSEKLVLLPIVEGFLPRYTFTSPSTSSIEGQVRVGLGYQLLDNHLILGLGARFFTFGYSSPSDSQGSSIDTVFLIGYRFEPAKKLELEAILDARIPLTVMGAAADGVSSSPQFGGFGLIVEGHYLLSPHVFLGPYVSFDYINLNWTQPIGPNGFSATELGFGVHLGLGL